MSVQKLEDSYDIGWGWEGSTFLKFLYQVRICPICYIAACYVVFHDV
jgi:hypothetical protein